MMGIHAIRTVTSKAQSSEARMLSLPPLRQGKGDAIAWEVTPVAKVPQPMIPVSSREASFWSFWEAERAFDSSSVADRIFESDIQTSLKHADDSVVIRQPKVDGGIEVSSSTATA